MLIYSSPGTGKSTLCKNDESFIDCDIILAGIFDSVFCITVDINNLGKEILDCFIKDRQKSEECYTAYLKILKGIKMSRSPILTHLFGTRRFMWVADKVYLETNPDVLKKRDKIDAHEIINKEILSAKKWDINYEKLEGRLISEVLCIRE